MKEQLIEAIKATITPNNVKAITAESLANLLIEMVEAMGEGGTSAGGAGVVFYVGSINIDTSEATQTPEQKAHNAEMFQIFANSPMGVPVSINLNAALDAQFGVSDGGTYIATMTSAMYMREDLAIEMGMPSTAIEAFNADFYTVILADGTLIFEANVE